MTATKQSHQGLTLSKRMSTHAIQRIRQRGLCEDDIGLICEAGEEFGDGYLMSARAVSKRVGQLKAEIQRLERLRGIVLIEQDDTLVTAYRADRKRCKRILKHGISQQNGHKEVNNGNPI